jgi:hypothetical protein
MLAGADVEAIPFVGGRDQPEVPRPEPVTVDALPPWLLVTTAALIGAAIWIVGMKMVRAFSSSPEQQPEPEDVADLDVFFVCAECGTEFRVTRLGELQVPRHCGEKMQVVQRPAEPR